MTIDYETELNYPDCEIKINNGDYCTNPMTVKEEELKFSWLDDLGWI